MGYIFVASVLLLLTIGGVATAVFTAAGRRIGAIVAAVAVVLLAVITVFSSAQKIDARAVGIETSFGQYHGTLNSGLHWIAPWAEVEQFTTRLQPTDISGKQAVEVTFSSDDAQTAADTGTTGTAKAPVIGGGRGKFDLFVRWRINPGLGTDGAKLLWSDYKTFEDVTYGLVDKDAKNITIEVANTYAASTVTVSQEKIGAEIEARLAKSLARYGVVLDSFVVTHITLDNATQASVDKIFASRQDIRRAENDRQRAKIDADTVRIQNQQGALSPEANQRRCLDILNNWSVDKNGGIPATLNCDFGGAKTPVILGQTK